MMKKIVLFAVTLLFATLLTAQMQAPQINFETLEHDFGQIKEADGPVTFIFKFNNLGNKPLLINNVRPSCGCTTPKWSKQPILPNAKGEIEVTFNPRNRPGSFRKSITVTNNTPKPNIYLVIKGKVLPRTKTPEENFPFPLGEVRAKKTHLSFFNMTNTAKKSSSIQVFNPSTDSITISFPELPAHITAQSLVLEAGKEGLISFTYDASLKNDWGFVSDDITIWVDSVAMKTKLKLSATITEDFSGLSPKERANAPKLVLSEKKVDFGDVQRGDLISQQVTITNSGKSPLTIHSAKSTSTIVKCKVSNTSIEVGDSATLEVTIDTNRTKGRQYKTINIISDDPSAPNSTLTFTGNVK
jgi:hypothetical protein